MQAPHNFIMSGSDNSEWDQGVLDMKLSSSRRPCREKARQHCEVRLVSIMHRIWSGALADHHSRLLSPGGRWPWRWDATISEEGCTEVLAFSQHLIDIINSSTSRHAEHTLASSTLTAVPWHAPQLLFMHLSPTCTWRFVIHQVNYFLIHIF